MATAPPPPAAPSHTLHGDDLSWLDLILLGALPDRFELPVSGPVLSARSATLQVSAETAVEARLVGRLDLLDPEGVTLARVSLDDAAPQDGEWVSGQVEAVTGFHHLDHLAWRRTPADTTAAWSPGPVIALWQDAPVAWSVREATRVLARGLAGTVLQVIGVPSGRETSLPAHLAARLAHHETTRDASDLPVVVPSPALSDQPADILLKAAVLARYGATAFALTPATRTGLGDLWERTVAAAWQLGVELLVLDVDPDQVELTDHELDALLSQAQELPRWFAEPAFAAELSRLYRPRSAAGLTVLLSGLSGSGKSTVARALAVRLLETEARSISLLDGDVVRHHLSKGLGFARADRDTNVRRIGFVASEITKAGGIAICCPIAPYDATRKDVRAMVESEGGFVLVHVATPLAECERRDRKGLYAKARRGEIPEFTGISDPYEVPEDAELVVDTTGRAIEACVDDVLDGLVRLGYVARS